MQVRQYCDINPDTILSQHPNISILQDLLALLKNVENEIVNCDDNLRDEVEKRKKYKVRNTCKLC